MCCLDDLPEHNLKLLFKPFLWNCQISRLNSKPYRTNRSLLNEKLSLISSVLKKTIPIVGPVE